MGTCVKPVANCPGDFDTPTTPSLPPTHTLLFLYRRKCKEDRAPGWGAQALRRGLPRPAALTPPSSTLRAGHAAVPVPLLLSPGLRTHPRLLVTLLPSPTSVVCGTWDGGLTVGDRSREALQGRGSPRGAGLASTKARLWVPGLRPRLPKSIFLGVFFPFHTETCHATSLHLSFLVCETGSRVRCHLQVTWYGKGLGAKCMLHKCGCCYPSCQGAWLLRPPREKLLQTPRKPHTPGRVA